MPSPSGRLYGSENRQGKTFGFIILAKFGGASRGGFPEFSYNCINQLPNYMTTHDDDKETLLSRISRQTFDLAEAVADGLNVDTLGTIKANSSRDLAHVKMRASGACTPVFRSNYHPVRGVNNRGGVLPLHFYEFDSRKRNKVIDSCFALANLVDLRGKSFITFTLPSVPHGFVDAEGVYWTLPPVTPDFMRVEKSTLKRWYAKTYENWAFWELRAAGWFAYDKWLRDTFKEFIRAKALYNDHYLYVAEIQEKRWISTGDRAIHFHLITDIPYHDLKKRSPDYFPRLSVEWSRRIRSKVLSNNAVDFVALGGINKETGKPHPANPFRYLSKYLSKGGEKFGCGVWSCSRSVSVRRNEMTKYIPADDAPDQWGFVRRWKQLPDGKTVTYYQSLNIKTKNHE